MADVKWIKIVTDVFDDEKILMIETMPECDTIIVIWFKLLCLAGKQNNGGVFQMGQLPYTDEMFAAIFRRPINTVRLALNTFERFGMIEIIRDTVTIPNWNKHQSLDAYEKKKERDRLYQAERRAAQRALVEKSSDESSDKSSYVAVSEGEREKEEDKESDNRDIISDSSESAAPPVPYESIKNLYNDICKSFSRCNAMSDARKKAIKARFVSGYTEEDFKTLFTKAEASSFLRGSNNRNWTANFDWLIKDANMAKVLDGNYDEKGSGNAVPVKSGRSAFEQDAFDRMKRYGDQLKKTAGSDPDLKARADALKRMVGGR